VGGRTEAISIWEERSQERTVKVNIYTPPGKTLGRIDVEGELGIVE